MNEYILDVGRPGTAPSVGKTIAGSSGARPRRARTIKYNIKAYCIMRGSDLKKKRDRTIIAYLPRF